jgi:hypothetical protein
VAVYFCRVVLITTGIVYTSGLAYFSQSYDGFELRENGISSNYNFPIVEITRGMKL